jgi:2-iminobutanoate/2-iminopropanoate deaminase
MKKEIISSKAAPKAIGPYSQAVRAGDLLFISGQIAIDPAIGAIEETGIEAQTRRVLQNLGAILSEANLAPADVVKATIFLKNMADFPLVNEIYASVFNMEPPARETVEAARLPKDALIEISAIAYYSSKKEER